MDALIFLNLIYQVMYLKLYTHSKEYYNKPSLILMVSIYLSINLMQIMQHFYKEEYNYNLFGNDYNILDL